MEAYEALIVGVLGLASLYSWQRRRDPVDRWLALGTLWICVTGIAGMILAQLDDPARYFRLALRLTGPPILLLICEESIRTSKIPGSRTTSFFFAGAVWVAAVIAMIIYRGGTLGGSNIEVMGVSFGVSAWMAILAVSLLAALLTLLPGAFQKANPGFPGIAALLLLISESWAAIDPRWGTGVLDFSAVVSYRSLLTFFLAAIAILKAHQSNWTWLLSSASIDPLSKQKSSRKRPSQATKTNTKEPPVEDTADDESEEDKPQKKKPSSTKNQTDRASVAAAGSRGKSRNKAKKKKGKR